MVDETENQLSWRQLTFAAPNASLDLIEELFWLNQARAVTLGDAADTPLLEPKPNELPLWPDTLITGLFDAGFDSALLQQQLTALPGQITLYSDEVIIDREWTREWMKHYQPIEFSRLRISPTDWPEKFVDAKPTLFLDPGLAFGAGTHPTTRLCLEWLTEIDLEDKLVVDYGCGSGILALAAAKLGAQSVIGVDYDPQAVLATDMNAEKNHLTSSVIAKDNNVPVLDGECKADVLVANILAKPLIELAPLMATLVTAGGFIALAGLLDDQADTVMAAYTGDFDMQKSVSQQGWQLLTGQRKG